MTGQNSVYSKVPSNAGASTPDVLALGSTNDKTIAQWRQKHGINPNLQIRLVKLTHMCYQHPDLDEINTFLLDFGMQLVKRTKESAWYRGYGPDQYVYHARKGPKKFLGGTYEVESYEDLKKAAQIEGSGKIQNLEQEGAPGGGFMITLRDPEGFPVNLMFGQEKAEIGQVPAKLVVNFENEKPRLREFQRFQPGSAAVYKLGHYGLCVQDFNQQLKWYTKHFNLVPTDFLWVCPDGTGQDKDSQGEEIQQDQKIVAVFAHIDRGQDYVDHHTFFMSTNATSHVHHCSFEVHDFDTQQLGHQWLAKRGYKSVWGVGRHILGSQIFDYWWDTTGNMVEHYADGDMINEDTPIGYGPAGNESLAVWGPEVPISFLQ